MPRPIVIVVDQTNDQDLIPNSSNRSRSLELERLNGSAPTLGRTDSRPVHLPLGGDPGRRRRPSSASAPTQEHPRAAYRGRGEFNAGFLTLNCPGSTMAPMCSGIMVKIEVRCVIDEPPEIHGQNWRKKRISHGLMHQIGRAHV